MHDDGHGRPSSNRRRWRWNRWKILLGLVGLLILLRLLPCLVPIRATDLVQDDRAIEFRDRHGTVLGTLLTRDQDHTAVVPIERVSPWFLQAIVAAEDKRFYSHGAVDWWAMGRAIGQVVTTREVVSGGSTITMQLARMIDPKPRTIASKLQEIWVSWRLWAGMDRREILHSYVNRLPMGGNVYGVEAASKVYFGIPAQDLSLAQATLLAAIPNAPNRLNPHEHWDRLKRRQHYVLDRLVADRLITPEQRDLAWAEVVTLQPRQQGILAAPHYLFWVAKQLPKTHPAQITTSLDLPLQQFVEAQVRQVLETLQSYNVQQAAAIVLDNSTGDVLAYVGSRDYFAESEMGRNDGVQALRQPGSTLKPFLYELALEKQIIKPNTILADVPAHYGSPGAQLYSPTDYSETFQGPVRVRIALANSLNIPAVRVLEKVGVATFLDRLHQLGFRHLTQTPTYYGLGLTLGSGEVSLWELAYAYQVMANQGRSPQASSRTSVDVGLPQAPQLKPTAYHRDAAATWALIADMLSDRHARAKSFGLNSLLSLPFPTAVKTGTSSDFRDTWTVGFSREYTVATWVGNFTGEPMRQISGVTGAAPLWNQIMVHLHGQREPEALPKPTGLVQRPICALSGLKPTHACPTIVQEYFYPEDLTAYEQSQDTADLTVAQTPAQSRSKQSTVRLNLPAEYNEWMAQQSQAKRWNQQLRIISPQEGDQFLLVSDRGHPSIQSSQKESERQRLEFKVSTQSQQSIEWILNGKTIAKTSNQSLFWEMKPGTWTLEVKQGQVKQGQVKQGQETDRVRFRVEMAEPESDRRGFSTGAGD
ncbi:penicillin-binding protein 1C [Alkalinema sp. FACHB-956]|nr:penicillin-binding protein 1C [Alkalinema sp. FACHB-956]